MNVLMVGVGKNRLGGMWSVAQSYMNDNHFIEITNLRYVVTSTNGSVLERLLCMMKGYIQILFLLITGNIDIVHIHMAEKGSTFRKGIVVQLSKIFHCKVIIQLHAGPFKAWYKTLSVKKQNWVKKIFSNANKVLVLGEYWKIELRDIIEDSKMEVLYNGIHCPMKNMYNQEGTYILYLGVMKREKGIYDLLNAMYKINAQLDINIKLLLCGSDLESDIKQYVEKYGLLERIKFMGWVNEEDKHKLFKNAIMNVLPSYYEGLSITIMEAMAYGIPVVTTNISTMPELLGGEIELIEPGDIEGLCNLILRLIQSRELCSRYSEIEYNRATRYFNSKNNIQRTLELYRLL